MQGITLAGKASYFVPSGPFAMQLGLGLAAEYALQLGIDAIWERVQLLAGDLRQKLRQVPGVTLRDQGRLLCGIVSFTMVSNMPLDCHAPCLAPAMCPAFVPCQCPVTCNAPRCPHLVCAHVLSWSGLTHPSFVYALPRALPVPVPTCPSFVSGLPCALLLAFIIGHSHMQSTPK